MQCHKESPTRWHLHLFITPNRTLKNDILNLRMCRSHFSTTIKLMEMLQTGIAYMRIASKWWTYVSAEIYYSKQFSNFFLLIWIHKIFRQKLSFLRILWQSNSIFDDFAEDFKLLQIAPLTVSLPPQIFLISSEAMRSTLRLSYIQGKWQSCLAF